MTPTLHVELASTIASILRNDSFDGIIVTHGTDTLEETAFALDILLDIDIPVVLTGAMLPSGSVGSDGPRNLVDAAQVALHPPARGLGVLVTLAGQIHAARWVTKTDSTAIAAFASPNFGPVGRVDDDNIVIWLHRTWPRIHLTPTNPPPNVLLIKMAAGITAVPYKVLLESGYPIHGIVIEAFGSGNLYFEWESFLEVCTSRAIPVVVTTRCPSGPITFSYGGAGGGQKIRAYVIPAPYLSGPKARLALLFALMSGYAFDDLRTLFAKLVPSPSLHL
jgi:L-asparaginase